ncbi:TfoX/Sxy family DNA transformation protein [Pantoea sp. CCBC3-3-1]|uniref:TfoX/Sxy family DNA transformation protein n=1 Tax=Pantoea sp. CCBC3-3-1 TaxID=2490851 RepID=UPI0011BF160E|nr:TfoX/Sxy family DNA transformation protein [Pantoea sp. CCBC3-3-1]
MYDSKKRIETAKHHLAELGKIGSRSQFGGYSLSVEEVVFALVSEGELYLRACEQVRPYLAERKMEPLCYYKRGLPVELEYYRVDEPLWNEHEQLVALSKLCLNGARQNRLLQKQNRRLKDLPNLTVRMETLLRQVGVCTIAMLKEQGARRTWLKLREFNKNLSINVLFALEGAILERHHEALPEAVKAELRHWYSETLRAQAKQQKP